MYKIICLMICFISVAEIFSDELEDYIHSCAYLSRNFNNAITAPESRIGSEYRMRLNTAQTQAKKIQQVIRQLNLGSDFDFPALTAELEKIYTMSSRTKKMRKSQTGMSDLSKNPDSIFSILLFDVTNLRNIDFTTENGGDIRSDVATKRRIFEYERYFQFFQQGKKKYLSSRYKDDFSFRRFFVLRCQRFLGLAKTLHMLIQKKNPKGISRINLEVETTLMLSDFQKMTEYISASKRHKKQSNKTGKKEMLKEDSRENLNAEIRVCTNKISTLIHELKTIDFISDPPLKTKHNIAEKSDDPASILKVQRPKQNYNEMNEAALMKELLKRRKTIIKNNTAVDGFDSETEKLYMKTLTSEQKKKYNKYLKDDLNLGYERETAVRNALLRVHSETQMSKKYPSKKEVVRILENMDKEKENQKLKVRF